MEIVLAQMFTRGKHRIPLTDKINKLPAGIYLLSIQAANKKRRSNWPFNNFKFDCNDGQNLTTTEDGRNRED